MHDIMIYFNYTCHIRLAMTGRKIATYKMQALYEQTDIET